MINLADNTYLYRVAFLLLNSSTGRAKNAGGASNKVQVTHTASTHGQSKVEEGQHYRVTALETPMGEYQPFFLIGGNI
jgi:hypothetical protein